MGKWIKNTVFNSCIFVSTDGHRLVKYIRTDISGDEVDHDMIIPRKSLNLLKTIIPSDDKNDINIEFNASNAFSATNDEISEAILHLG